MEHLTLRGREDVRRSRESVEMLSQIVDQRRRQAHRPSTGHGLRRSFVQLARNWPSSARSRRNVRFVPDNGRNSRPWPRPVRISRVAKQEADRRTGEHLVALLDQAGKAEVDDLLARGKFVYAVRRVRELTGLRLIDAKRLVESLQR
jgi:hypothetical protein